VLLLRRNSEVFSAAAGIQGGAFDSRERLQEFWE
jgi:hypothetical protein